MKSYIQLNDINNTSYSQYRDNAGRTFFDLLEEFEVPQENTVFGLDSLNNISDTVTLGIKLPATPKNKALISNYVDLFKGVTDEVLIPVCVSDNNGITNFDSLKIVSYSDDENSIEVDVINSQSFLYRLSRVKLKDISFPNYTFTNANLKSDWIASKHYYNDSDSGIYFPMTLYKNKFADSFDNLSVDKARLQEFRPYVNMYYCLKQAFCLAGYEIDSPLFNSAFGRQKWLYLLKDTFYNYGGKGNYYTVAGNVSVPYTDNTGAALKINFENYDLGNRYDTSTFEYTNTSTNTVNLRVEYNLVVFPFIGGTTTDKWGLLITMAGGAVDDTNLSIKNDDILAAPNDGGYRFISKVYDIELAPNDKFSFATSIQGGGGWNLIWSSFTKFNVQATGQYIYPLDTFNVASMFNTDYTGLHLLKGAMHLINGKLELDDTLKIARLLHSESSSNAVVNGVESYYINEGEAANYTSDTISDSYKIEFQKTEQKRYINFGYYQGSDVLVEKVDGMRDNTTANGYRYDLGDSQRFKNETESFENPFFEAVINRHVLRDLKLSDKFAIDMPVIWDNENGVSDSFAISPKIIHVFGYVEQYQQIDSYTGSAKYKEWFFDNEAMTKVPFGYQYTVQTVNDGTNYNLPVDMFLDYETLTGIFYAKSIAQKKNVALASVQIIGRQNINAFDIRKPVLINTTEGYRYFRVIAKRNLDNNLIMELDILPILTNVCS